MAKSNNSTMSFLMVCIALITIIAILAVALVVVMSSEPSDVKGDTTTTTTTTLSQTTSTTTSTTTTTTVKGNGDGGNDPVVNTTQNGGSGDEPVINTTQNGGSGDEPVISTTQNGGSGDEPVINTTQNGGSGDEPVVTTTVSTTDKPDPKPDPEPDFEPKTYSGEFISTNAEKLKLLVKWSCVTSEDGGAELTLDVYVQSYSLQVGPRDNGKIIINGESFTFETDGVYIYDNKLTNTLVASEVFTVDSIADGIDVEVRWNAAVKYSKVDIDYLIAKAKLTLE